jgi:hypothetical protein
MFPRRGWSREEKEMATKQHQDDMKAPGDFGNQGQPAQRTGTKVDKEQRYQQNRERAPGDENPTSEPVQADK